MNIKNTIEEFYKEWSRLGYRIYITIQNPPNYMSTPILGIGVKQCEYFIIEADNTDGIEYFYTKVMFCKRVEVFAPISEIVNMFCREDVNNQPGRQVDIIFFDPIEFIKYSAYKNNKEGLVIKQDSEHDKPLKIKPNLKLVVSNKLEDIKPCNIEVVRNFYVV